MEGSKKTWEKIKDKTSIISLIISIAAFSLNFSSSKNTSQELNKMKFEIEKLKANRNIFSPSTRVITQPTTKQIE